MGEIQGDVGEMWGTSLYAPIAPFSYMERCSMSLRRSGGYGLAVLLKPSGALVWQPALSEPKSQ